VKLLLILINILFIDPDYLKTVEFGRAAEVTIE